MSFAIQRLNEGIRTTLVAHFLALPMKDRCLRFGASLAPAVIAAYVDGIDFVRGAVFGVHDDRLALVGVAHMAIEDDLAEVALSVLPMHRGHGVGSALFKRAMAYARKRCIPRLFMLFRLENAPIMRIARRFGMRIVAGGGEARAHLNLQPALLSSIAVEADEPFEFTQIGSDRPLHARTHSDVAGAFPMTPNSSLPDRTGDPQHPTAKHSGQIASDLSTLAGVRLDNTPDCGMSGQPTSAPPIDTHWSRILHYDLSKGEVEPWGQHALAANGFADAAGTDTASSPRLTSYQPQQTPRPHRSFALGELIVAAMQAAAASVRRAHARYRHRREIDAIDDVLRQLDDRTLRDLGFYRSALGSVAAELTRDAEAPAYGRRAGLRTLVERDPHEIANPTIDPQEQNEVITMPRYETSPPRIAFGIAAVAMTVITVGVFVVIPAKVETDEHDPSRLAASKVATLPFTSAVTGATIDVVSLHVPELAAAPCKPSRPNCTRNTNPHPHQ